MCPHPILLARHGETEWNRRRLLQGWGDSPLTPRGREQARALGTFVRSCGIARILSSPLGRAHETALEVAGITGAPVEVRGELKEIDAGVCSGITVAAAYERHADFREARARDRWSVAWPGGESYATARGRIESLLASLPRDRPLLLLAHRSINRVLLHLLTALPKDDLLATDQTAEVVFGIDEYGRSWHARTSDPEGWQPGIGILE